jgi:hypothetical protein
MKATSSLIGAEGAGALLDHDADDLAGEVVQAQLGAERVLIQKELADEGLADEAALGALLEVAVVEQAAAGDAPTRGSQTTRG